MAQCRNPNCTSKNPQFYNRHTLCKVCTRRNQLNYRNSPAGLHSHKKFRSSEKGLKLGSKTQKKYASSRHGANKIAEYRAKIRVNARTLRIGLPFTQCERCVEFNSHTCSVIEGAESIQVCEVYLEWKHCGIHPLDYLQEREHEPEDQDTVPNY